MRDADYIGKIVPVYQKYKTGEQHEGDAKILDTIEANADESEIYCLVKFLADGEEAYRTIRTSDVP